MKTKRKPAPTVQQRPMRRPQPMECVFVAVRKDYTHDAGHLWSEQKEFLDLPSALAWLEEYMGKTGWSWERNGGELVSYTGRNPTKYVQLTAVLRFC